MLRGRFTVGRRSSRVAKSLPTRLSPGAQPSAALGPTWRGGTRKCARRVRTPFSSIRSLSRVSAGRTGSVSTWVLALAGLSRWIEATRCQMAIDVGIDAILFSELDDPSHHLEKGREDWHGCHFCVCLARDPLKGSTSH